MSAGINKRIVSLAAMSFVILLVSGSISCAGLPDLFTRQEIFANPVKKAPLISPDGKKLAYVAPSDGVMNVYVKTIGSDGDCCVTVDSSRGIRKYEWSGDGKHILYLQDRLGNENWHLYSCRIDGPGRETIDLTPFDDVRVAEFFVSPRVHDHVVVSMNKDNPQSSDLYAVDLTGGKVTPLVAPPGMVREYIVGPDLSVRGCMVIGEDGLNSLLSYSPSSGEWDSLRTWGYDVSSVLFLNNLEEPVAVAQQYLRMDWTALSEAVKGDLDVIEGSLPGDFVVENISPDDNVWLIKHIEDDRPDTYYRYDRGIGKLEFLFSSNPSLEQYEFAQVIPVIIKATDGLELPCYTVIPPGVKAEMLPLVVVIHGGPWSRESWEFEPGYQLLANRGYALLIVDFRGSTGFGKEFLNAGDNEWAKRMQTDVYDAVEWAIDTGLADPGRIGVVGGSYGGYSVLWSMIQRPDLFRCGVSVCGPSRLLTLVECFPAYHKPLLQWVKTKVGDWDQSPEMLDAISPIFEVDKIRAPMLIVQGANDPRVKVEESLRIVRAMRDNSQPVTYMEFPDEGHGLEKPENEMAFNAVLEAFLARNLGGRFQPATREEEELLDRYSMVYE